MLLATAVVMLTFCTWQRNQVWTNTLSFWSDIAQKSPNLSRGHLGVFFALQRIGEEKKARKSLLQAFKVDPGDDKVMTNLVTLYMSEKKYSEAIRVLDGFLAKKQSAAAFIERAKAHAMLKHFEQTIMDTDRALKLRPNYGLAWLIKGKALSSLNQRRSALAALSQARQIGPASAALYGTIGEVYINSGKVDLAIHYFKEAIKTDPDHASKSLLFRTCLWQKGNEG